MAPPTPTAIPLLARPATPVPTVDLLENELLGAAHVTESCDGSPAANFDCNRDGGPVSLDVDVTASEYARWSLHWDATATPLTGNETIALQFTRAGNAVPNLYLVEAGGARQPVNLARFGLREGASSVRVPLREIKDSDGNRPNFDAINELQLVFEWSDMRGSLKVESVQFVARWQEAVDIDDRAVAFANALLLPPGFQASPIAQRLQQMTQIDFTPAGDMLVSLQDGRIWWYQDSNGDGLYDQRHLYDTGYTEIVGLLYDPVDGAVWLGGRGQLWRTIDQDGDGVADVRELRMEGLPWGRHQNNNLNWGPDPDPFSGETGLHWIYFGLGSTGDLDTGPEPAATVVRFPRTGQSAGELEVVSQGNRNAYEVLWAQVPVDLADPDAPTAWQLFASENGPDFNDAPDEVNHIRWGHHYGFPDHFGWVGENEVDGEPYSGPVYEATAHASANGLAYINHPDWPAEYRTLYVSLFGEVFSPTPVGHTVERVILRAEITASGEVTYRGEAVEFIGALDRPLPLTTDLAGEMILGDYATGIIYRIRYVGTPTP
jgi:hypothetical protein